MRLCRRAKIAAIERDRCGDCRRQPGLLSRMMIGGARLPQCAPAMLRCTVAP
jgi:hypothetical protein